MTTVNCDGTIDAKNEIAPVYPSLSERNGYGRVPNLLPGVCW